MSSLVRFLIVLAMGGAVAIPLVAYDKGWGLKTQSDPASLQYTGVTCLDYERDASGRCRPSYRSRYGRSFVGGGHHYGK